MPYKIQKRGSYESPKAKHLQKWVVLGPRGKVMGTHESRESALRQLAALQIAKKKKRK